MGRKKKKELKPWCWYCNREFDDEKVLIYHQKAKHFKCNLCGKKLYTGPGLTIHCMQVHRHTVKAIPNSLPNRSDPDVEIYGTEGIPFLDKVSRAKFLNIEIDFNEKNLANAALPAKYERTLDAPYGTPTNRIVKQSSPSTLQSTVHSILKCYVTPPSTGEPGSSITPDVVAKSEDPYSSVQNGNGIYSFGGYSNFSSDGIDSKDKIPPLGNRCRIYHPLENISLEEHRLKLQKYAHYRQQNIQPSANPFPVPPYQNYPMNFPIQQPTPYPMYPYVYPPPYPQIPQPDYTQPPGMPLYPMANMYQQPMFPGQPQYPPHSYFPQ